MTNELRNRQMCGKKQIAQKTDKESDRERIIAEFSCIVKSVCEMENPFSGWYLNISICTRNE